MPLIYGLSWSLYLTASVSVSCGTEAVRGRYGGVRKRDGIQGGTFLHPTLVHTLYMSSSAGFLLYLSWMIFRAPVVFLERGRKGEGKG